MTAGIMLSGAPGTTPRGPQRQHENASLLQRVLSANRMGGLVTLHEDGPQIWTYRVMLDFAASPRRVVQLADALSLAVGADTCRVARADGMLLIEIPKPEDLREAFDAKKFDAAMPLQGNRRFAVPLGLATTGGIFWMDLLDERHAHLLVAGVTGAGKSMAVAWILYRLLMWNAPQRLRILAFDPKKQDLAPFANSVHLLHPIAHNPVDVQRLMSWLTGEMDRRAASGRSWPRIVVVAEELPDLIDVAGEIRVLLKRVMQLGRSLGIQIIGTAQQPSVEELGRGVTQFPTRLVGRIASGTMTWSATGRRETMVDMLLGRGDMVAVSAGQTTRIQMPYLTGTDLLARIPTADKPQSLDGELPSVAYVADLQRDPRGGAGRRELDKFDYATIETRLAEGASAETLKDEFSIGWERAQRLYQNYWEAKR